jgi:hypothetical protein
MAAEAGGASSLAIQQLMPDRLGQMMTRQTAWPFIIIIIIINQYSIYLLHQIVG